MSNAQASLGVVTKKQTRRPLATIQRRRDANRSFSQRTAQTGEMTMPLAPDAISTACPVVPLAWQFQQVLDAYNELDADYSRRAKQSHEDLAEREHILESLRERRMATLDYISHLPARSAEGALVQLALIFGSAHHLWDETERDHDLNAEWSRIQRMVFSLIGYIEATSSARSAALPGRCYFMGSMKDPHAAVWPAERRSQVSVPTTKGRLTQP